MVCGRASCCLRHLMCIRCLDFVRSSVAFKFGLITMISGLLGVPLGSIIAQRLRERNSRADALVCAFGLLMSTPLLFFAAVTARYNTIVCFTLIFFGELFLNLNWSIVADILLVISASNRCYFDFHFAMPCLAPGVMTTAMTKLDPPCHLSSGQ